jgi:hypothetical protein
MIDTPLLESLTTMIWGEIACWVANFLAFAALLVLAIQSFEAVRCLVLQWCDLHPNCCPWQVDILSRLGKDKEHAPTAVDELNTWTGRGWF